MDFNVLRNYYFLPRRTWRLRYEIYTGYPVHRKRFLYFFKYFYLGKKKPKINYRKKK